MLTGYNTDVRHLELVLHVQTEDKGLDNPAIESVIYLRGRVLAAKRTAYEKLINQGKGEREIAALMEHQHRTIVAAIRAGRFDGRIEQAIAAGRGDGAAAGAAATAVAGADPFPSEESSERLDALRSTLLAEEHGPTLDQVILEYLETEAEQDHLVLVLDGPEEIRPGKVNQLTLRAYSSKSGEPLAGVQVAVRMLSTLSDPRTLLAAETGESGTIEFELEVPSVQGGSAALIISGSSELGRAEIKQLL